MRYVEHLKVNGPVTCLMSAILVYTMSISKALVHVKPTQNPHIAVHASLAFLHLHFHNISVVQEKQLDQNR